MWVLDILLVECPDIWPFPWVFEEFGRDVPEGVTLDYDVTVRRIFAYLDLVSVSKDGQQETNQRYNLAHGKPQQSKEMRCKLCAPV
jgi:hypothetical protein